MSETKLDYESKLMLLMASAPEPSEHYIQIRRNTGDKSREDIIIEYKFLFAKKAMLRFDQLLKM